MSDSVTTRSARRQIIGWAAFLAAYMAVLAATIVTGNW